MDFGLSSVMEELSFAAASVATLMSACAYSKYKSISRNLEDAPILTVGADLTKSMKNLSNLPYAVVSGRVFPLERDQILKTASGMPAVISKLNTKEFRWVDTFSSVMATTSRLDFDGRISPALNYVPFGLSNPNEATTATSSTKFPSSSSLTSPSSSSTPSTYVMVDDIHNGQFDNLLLTAKSTYVPTQVTFTGLIASLLHGSHSVGVETAESVLPVGTVITVIGEVTKLSSGGGGGVSLKGGSYGGFRIAKSPAGGTTTPYILTTKNIMEVKSSVRSTATAFRAFTILCGCFTLMTFYALGKKWLPRFRLRRVTRLIQRDRRSQGTAGLHETQICLACLENPREVALFPCGHVCLCADCSLLIQEKCPVCRETVTETVQVFLS